MVIKCILLCTPTNKNILLKEKEYKNFCGLRRKNKPCPPQKRNPKRRALAPTPSAAPQGHITGEGNPTTPTPPKDENGRTKNSSTVFYFYI